MVSINNVDLVMAALRARLQRLAREKRADRTSRPAAPQRADGPDGDRDFDSLRHLPPAEFDRALIGFLLEREFGEGMGEDPRFRALLDRTMAILESDPEIRALFRDVQKHAQ